MGNATGPDMNPKDISKLISEDINFNNGMIIEEEVKSGALERWIKLNDKLQDAVKRYESKSGKPKILVINGSDRNPDTCPGEQSKSNRLCERAVEILSGGADTTYLDLSRMTAEAGKMIWPCKGCFSTSAALCHFGCTCYPNESLNQNPDWMHEEIYELLLESHGLFIITPVYWYSMPSVLKLMVDRMVCLDGANQDPRTTLSDDKESVKDVKKAKALERGPNVGGKSKWDYKGGKSMAGRLFTSFIHGDADGIDNVEHAVSETFKWFGLQEVQSNGEYIGYYKPYADSHKELDKADAAWASIELQSKALLKAVKEARSKGMPKPEFPDNKYMK